MARTISLTMRKAANAQESGEVLVVLMTIWHPDLAGELIRLSSDDTVRLSADPLLYGTMSRGQQFLFFPFSIVLPDDRDEAPPSVKFQIDNIDRNMVPLIRSHLTPAKCKMELVMGSTPDVVEIEFPELDIVGAQYDANSIQMEMQVDALVTEPFPADTFTPSNFPGLFSGY